jgi:phosphate transport system substrate-binding protein
MKKSSVVLLVVMGLALFGCSRSGHKTITLAGSTAFQPFAEKLAEHYMAAHKDVRINVQGGGSAVGIQSALSGSAEIGMADLLKLPDEAASLNSVTVARDGIGIVVNPKNNISNVTKEQAHDIFAGKITNWKDVGGVDSPIRIISREEGSGTRRSFDKLVLGEDKLCASALFQNSNGTVREAIASDESAIGYVSIGLINEKVKGIAYEGIASNNDNVKKGIYPLARPVFFLTKSELNQQAKDFITYVLSKEAQDILEKEGLIAVK